MKSVKDLRVLVVDDQKSMRGLACHYLGEMGVAHVAEAESAVTALATMQQQVFDLIILDWNMEGMSGLDLLKAIRSVRELDRIKIIMATSEGSLKKVHEATSLGANHYVVKPFQKGDLSSRIAQVFHA
jgi:two-component system chemotaxis response regulator CheY